jgi:diguanylate cyclase (GGDEF)-like protein
VSSETILIVEDSKTEALYIKFLLEPEGYNLVFAETAAQAIAMLNGELKPDLVISDIIMPDIDGLELCRIIRRSYPDIFVVLQTASSDDSILKNSFDAGAIDFISKPLKENEIRQRVKNALRMSSSDKLIKKAMEKISESNKVLQTISSTDQLTGLNNRRFIMDELDSVIYSAQRYEKYFALMLIDLDHFKDVNDKYGHPIGDEVLRKVAFIIKSNIRKTDQAGRVGGEEFLFIFPKADLEKDKIAANKLLESVRNIRIDSVPDLRITFSGGLTICKKTDDVESLLKRVDELLYKAKQGGRNRIEY